MRDPIQAVRLRVAGGDVELDVKVVPGASRSRIAGVWNHALRLTVSAAPERGRANEEVVRLVARALGLPLRDVQVVSGQTRPLKTLRLRGLELDAVRARLAACLPAPPGA